jgi:hypothetical protein
VSTVNDSPAGEVPSRIAKVVIACFRKDLALLRTCVASVRYWHPEVEILLLKDELQGTFSTREIERTFNVGVFRTSRREHGWGWSKIEVLFAPQRERILILDSDTVLLGPVLDELSRHAEDFLVTGVVGDRDHYLINRDYVDVAWAERFDPEYRFPGYGFNTGQLVVTSGILTAADFAPVADFSSRAVRTLHEGLRYADQGGMNYVFTKAAAARRLSIRYLDFWIWPGEKRAREVTVQRLAERQGMPYVMHWAGIKPTDPREFLCRDVLEFYEAEYYARVRLGRAKQMLRRTIRILDAQARLTKRRLKRPSSPKVPPGS